MTKDNPARSTSRRDAPGKRDIPSLMTLLASKDGVLRCKARAALVELGKPAVEALVSALKDRNQTVRWESAKALGAIRDPKSIDALVAALQDKLFDVRWLAAEALIGIGDESVKPILQALVDCPKSEELREGAHHVLHDLVTSQYRDDLKPLMTALGDLTFTLDIPIRAKKALKSIS
jgi:HEAT repeat protein